MSKKLSTLAGGDKVKIKEFGQDVEYIFLEYNHYDKGECTLIRKDAPGYQAYNGGSSGYNPYIGSQVDTFCDLTFPQRFDPAVRAALVRVPIKVQLGHVGSVWDEGIREIYRCGFLLSNPEVGFTGSDGTAFSYFSDNNKRICYFDGTSMAVIWWLRSPGSSYDYYVYYVDRDGAQNDYYVYRANLCPRPAFAWSSEILVSDEASSGGCYVIEDAVVGGEQFQKVNGVWRKML